MRKTFRHMRAFLLAPAFVFLAETYSNAQQINAAITPVENARLTREAVKRGDFAAARDIVARMISHDPSVVWTAYPTEAFMLALSDPTDADLRKAVSTWVEKNPIDPIPYYVRAQFGYDFGWFQRGHDYANETEKARLQQFADSIQSAQKDIEQAQSLGERDPYSHQLRMRILASDGYSEQVQAALSQAASQYPDFVRLQDIALSSLQPKWGGSYEAMYDFVGKATANTPPAAPIRLLEIDLYRFLLTNAWTDCWYQEKTQDGIRYCVQTFMKTQARDNLDTRVTATLSAFGAKNAYGTNVAVEALLSDMIDNYGGEAFAAPLLEVAATAYKSDTRMRPDKPVDNNYLIDALVARSWFHQEAYENAATKYEDALKHITSAAFPGEGQRNMAEGALQDRLAETYFQLKSTPEMIAAATKAVELSGSASSALYLCHNAFLKKDYDGAVRLCTPATTDATKGIAARYWRGAALHELHRYEEAARDMTVVAESTDAWRARAAIELSMIYFDRKDNKGALDVLNKYRYLYDSKVTEAQSVAIAFNNRCYAYMQLGELQKALDDCNASLANGNIPDALKKQQELLKMLGKK
jgi:hypothetical protein